MKGIREHPAAEAEDLLRSLAADDSTWDAVRWEALDALLAMPHIDKDALLTDQLFRSTKEYQTTWCLDQILQIGDARAVSAIERELPGPGGNSGLRTSLALTKAALLSPTACALRISSWMLCRVLGCPLGP